jgi:parallel beta-helix repeat protein
MAAFLARAFLGMGNPRGPIRIRSDDQFTGTNGVVSGSGTQADPYIIEGWTIDASSCDTSVWPYIKVGIIVSNTLKYFVIRDCQVENAGEYGAGISLGSMSNGRVENSVVRNSGSGISLNGCSNVVLSGNTIENCRDGISNGSYSSDGVTISNNTITGCTDTGIDFHYLENSSASDNTVRNNQTGIRVSASFACTVSNNIVQGNTYTGIEVSYSGFQGGDNNIISYNDTSNNGTGITVYGSHNIISHNTSNGNSGQGIRLDSIGLTDITASYNTVSNNTASNNGKDGLYVGSGCVTNTISNNTFLSNNALKEYYFDGTPWYYDIEILSQPNTLEGNTYGSIYIYQP